MIQHCLVHIECYSAFPVKKLEGCYSDLGSVLSVCQYLIFLFAVLIKPYKVVRYVKVEVSIFFVGLFPLTGT